MRALWRRLEDYCRHRGARRDRQDHHASGLACARAAALTGAAAGCSGRPDPQGKSGPLPRSARARPVGQNASTSAGSGQCRARRIHARGGIFTQHRAIDRVPGQQCSRGQSKEAFKFPIRCNQLPLSCELPRRPRGRNRCRFERAACGEEPLTHLQGAQR